LPPPYDRFEDQPKFKPLTAETKSKFAASLDDTLCVGCIQPPTKEEEERLVQAFVSGLKEALFQRK